MPGRPAADAEVRRDDGDRGVATRARAIVIPSYRMRAGHPILLPRPFWPEVLRSGDTLRDVLAAHRAETRFLDVDTPTILADLDTPEDYEAEQDALTGRGVRGYRAKMESIYNKLAELDAGETVAVATIIDVKGSVPREVGAKMIIHPLGRHVGTVGGGCGEADVIRAALDVIQTGEPATVRVDLTEDISMQALGVCGGIMDVFVEQVAAVGARSPRPLQRLALAALAPPIRGARAGRAGDRDQRPGGRARSRGLARQAAAGQPGPGRARTAGASPTRRRCCAAASTSCSATPIHATHRRLTSTSSVFVEVQRRAPGTADRRRRAHRHAAGADGEPVRLRRHGAG